MTLSETREIISSILVGLIFFIVLAIIFGGQGQRILALLAALAAIGLIAWLISKQGEGELEAQIIDNPVNKRRSPEIMMPDSLDLSEIAKGLFKIRHNENAVKNYIDSLGQQLKLRGKVKEAEKWVKISGQVKNLVQTAYDVQVLLRQLKRLDLDEEVKDLQLEKERVKVQLDLETMPAYERKKWELEIKDLELQIAQKQFQIDNLEKGMDRDKSQLEKEEERALRAIKRKYEMAKSIIEKEGEIEEELMTKEKEWGEKHGPEIAKMMVERLRQQITQIGLKDL